LGIEARGLSLYSEHCQAVSHYFKTGRAKPKGENNMDQKQTNPKGGQQKNYSGTTDQENDLLEKDIDEEEDEESVEGEELQGNQEKKQNRGDKQQDLDKKKQNPNNPQGQQQHPDSRKREDVFQQRGTQKGEETQKNPKKNQDWGQGNRK
jgi:hypothetical protein